ncbi:hypothetical protein LJB88_04000 [Erysipelotrichaceae bacterium OttesenSCG-928-M19]|nr:hypothetical protein [Erysipelotrichaceae bacterium OttesenSCG-928-M19]
MISQGTFVYLYQIKEGLIIIDGKLSNYYFSKQQYSKLIDDLLKSNELYGFSCIEHKNILIITVPPVMTYPGYKASFLGVNDWFNCEHTILIGIKARYDNAIATRALSDKEIEYIYDNLIITKDESNIN